MKSFEGRTAVVTGGGGGIGGATCRRFAAAGAAVAVFDRRLDAAESLKEGGRDEQAATEEAEAKLIEGYLPEQLSDEELDELVATAIEESGASEQKDMGNVMKALMPKVAGRADGKRVSGAVREKLAG